MTRYEFVEIIRASQRGERAAFEMLYDEYFSYFLLRCGH